jgi:DNA topoisomerase-1
MAASKKALVIVESGAKAKTIAKHLNAMPDMVRTFGKFNVVPCYGHVLDLGKKGLSVDIEAGFKPLLEVINDKKKLVKELKKKAAEHDTVFLASDADREGAGIAHHLKRVLGLKEYKRIVFTEITPSALKSALEHAGKIDGNLVNAQQARRVLDRLVGFEVSPLLWKHFNATRLSAGRVQSAALGLVVKREKEVEAFVPSSHYKFLGTFKGLEGEAKLCHVAAGGGGLVSVDTKEASMELLKSMPVEFVLKGTTSKRRLENPPPPFVTSTLQQEANTKLGMSIKSTMAVAQALYEAGLITYMRTDSTALSDDAKAAFDQYITATHGAKYLACRAGGGGAARKKGSKHSQEAHECIRPTDVNVVQAAGDNFTHQHADLYQLIWRRAVASVMAAAKYDDLTATLVCDAIAAHGMAFVIKYSTLAFEGYLAVYGIEPSKEPAKKIDAGVRECKAVVAHQVWSGPPARFSEATFIKAMEGNGIGRPSTYAATLTKLVEKQYVEKKTVAGKEEQAVDVEWRPSKQAFKERVRKVVVGQDKNKLVATKTGVLVDEFLDANFHAVTDIEFTSKMEEKLDDIATGQASYLEVMRGFWGELSACTSKYKSLKMEKSSLSDATEVVVDGRSYTLRTTRYGPAVQYKEPGADKDKFVSLKAYLQATKKSGLSEVDEDDVRFLVTLPKRVRDGVFLHYGQYGFYLKKGDASFSIFVGKHVQSVPFELSEDEIDRVLAWKKKEKLAA